MENVLKTEIKNSFNRAAKTYDKSCAVQNSICQHLLKSLNQFTRDSEIIVDFACGTGMSTRNIAYHFSYHKLYGVDFADKLLHKAEINDPSAKYFCADFDNLNFPLASIDLAVCNMGFQWSPDLKNSLSTIRRQLKHSGMIAFSIPLNGTFNELKRDYRNTFSQAKEIEQCLTASGFELSCFNEKCYLKVFPNAFTAIKSLKQVGANCAMKPKKLKLGLLSHRHLREMFISQTETNLTYRIGFYIAKKMEEAK